MTLPIHISLRHDVTVMQCRWNITYLIWRARVDAAKDTAEKGRCVTDALEAMTLTKRYVSLLNVVSINLGHLILERQTMAVLYSKRNLQDCYSRSRGWPKLLI